MSYAGDITPGEAWKTLSGKADAVPVDVRAGAEFGHRGGTARRRIGLPWVRS